MHARRTRRVAGRALVGALLALTFATTGLAGAEAAPVEAAAPVSRLAVEATTGRVQAQHAQDRATLARAADEVGEDVFVSVEGTCVAGAGKSARPSAVVYSARRATFDWVLTSTTGLRKTGSVKVKKEAVARIKLPSVRTGSHHLAVTERGASSPVSDQDFQVGLCVQVKTSCHAVRFTNPASNPAADLSYGSDDEDGFDLRLAPGEVRTVRVDEKSISFTAWAVEEGTPSDDDGVGVGTNLGHGTVKVKQSCKAKAATPDQNAVQTSAFVGCGAGAGTAPVTFSWVAQKSLKNRSWEVSDAASTVVAHGSYKSGRDQTVRLAAGTYTYRAFANKKAKPFEETVFTVLRCVEVTPVCRAVEIDNANGVAVELAVLDPALLDDPDVDLGDDPESDQLQERTLAAGSAVTVAWTRPSALVLAFEAGVDDESRFFGLAAPLPSDEDDLDGLPRYTVPQDC